MNDFLTRVHDKNLNKKSLEALIMTGAMNTFGERGMLMANLDTMLAFNKESVAGKEVGQDSCLVAWIPVLTNYSSWKLAQPVPSKNSSGKKNS